MNGMKIGLTNDKTVECIANHLTSFSMVVLNAQVKSCIKEVFLQSSVLQMQALLQLFEEYTFPESCFGSIHILTIQSFSSAQVM